MQNVLQKLIQNSQKAIDEGVYEIAEKLQKSQMDLIDLIKNNNHAPIITEIKFSSPSFKLIEFTTHLPCSHFKPASMFSHLEFSFMSFRA